MLEKFGVGIDIVDIERFKKKPYLSNKKFYEKIFTPPEIKYCLKFKNPSPHFAGKFAIKEALNKSTNLMENLLNIETSHTGSEPNVKLKGKNKNKYLFQISISHEKDYAVGMVISEKIL